MTTENIYYQFDEAELKVLAFLKNMKEYAPGNFDYLIYYGASAREMIKFMEHPEKYGKFDFQFICSLFDSIRKTFKQYVAIERPNVPEQTMEDKILASILINSNSAFSLFYTNERLINKTHLIAYLLRKDAIENWNSSLLLTVQRIVEEIKAEMLMQYELAI